MAIFTKKKRILVIGAAGCIGSALHEYLSDKKYHLRLVDIKPIIPISSKEEIFQLDILDEQALAETMKDVDYVIHLAMMPNETNSEALIPINYQGSYNVFEQAKQAGVKRVIYASSIHTVGFYPRNKIVDIDSPVRPDGFYGVSKVFGEALGRLYADKFGLSVVCLRISSFKSRPLEERMLSTWLSVRDGMQLFMRSIETPDIQFAIAYGVSNNTSLNISNKGTDIKGYQPVDNAEDFADEVRSEIYEDPVARTLHGGMFCTFMES